MLEARQNGHEISVLEFHPQIKSEYLACVPTTGSLFAFRAALIRTVCPSVAQRNSVRWRSYIMDGGLPIAGLLLVSILPGVLFASDWPSSTLLLGDYAMLDTLALKRACTPCAHRNFFIAALLTYLYMLGVARMHYPLGRLQGWLA